MLRGRPGSRPSLSAVSCPIGFRPLRSSNLRIAAAVCGPVIAVHVAGEEIQGLELALHLEYLALPIGPAAVASAAVCAKASLAGAATSASAGTKLLGRSSEPPAPID